LVSNMKVLDEFPVKINLTVNWGEMDAYGHVNNANYFRYFEASRVRYIEEIGFHEYFRSQGFAGVLSRVSCNFIVPLKYPDDLTIGTRVTEISSDTIVMEHFVASSQKGLVAFGESELAIYDFSKDRKIQIPDFLRMSIDKLENKTFK
jgi:acyl-CoA thioester hydrolase